MCKPFAAETCLYVRLDSVAAVVLTVFLGSRSSLRAQSASSVSGVMLTERLPLLLLFACRCVQRRQWDKER